MNPTPDRSPKVLYILMGLKPKLQAKINVSMIKIHTQLESGQEWLEHHQGCLPTFACVLGFTETGLLPGISAAGATPEQRRYTAIADAEYLLHGSQPNPQHPLPPLIAGASPVLISRAVVQELQIPVHLFNSGLPSIPENLGAIDLGGTPANCVSSGTALPLATVHHLFQQGYLWGEKLGRDLENSCSYLILSECVVGGTTTALAVLTGLGIDAIGKVNSSHPTCNHQQKWELVQTGLTKAGLMPPESSAKISAETTLKIPHNKTNVPDPFAVVAAVGDPMQIVMAGMLLSASCYGGVLLAGGTQMLAVYALARSIAQTQNILWQPQQVVVGTTRWVAEDATGDTVGLAEAIGGVPLLATQLSFAESRYPQLRAYEQGFVKEGVGAGGCAIAAHLYAGWDQEKLLGAIEAAAALLN